jgi:CRISPR-associated endoribonuclease Cas6
MPSQWSVRFEGLDATQVRLDALHAVMASWLDTDHRDAIKPYSVSPPRPVRGGATVEVGALTDDVERALRSAATPGARARFNRQHVHVSGEPRLLARVAWPDLTDTAYAWSLQFLTPTCFRRGARFTPWPSPEKLLHGLTGKLTRFGSVEAPARLAQHVWITDVEGHSEALKLGTLTVSGFLGRVRYECDGDAETATWVSRLMRLAPFAGVGTYTVRGLGVTRHESTWQPARA